MSSKYTKKDFKRIALLISIIPERKAREVKACEYAEIFKKSNPRFDCAKFFDACNV